MSQGVETQGEKLHRTMDNYLVSGEQSRGTDRGRRAEPGAVSRAGVQTEELRAPPSPELNSRLLWFIFGGEGSRVNSAGTAGKRRRQQEGTEKQSLVNISFTGKIRAVSKIL